VTRETEAPIPTQPRMLRLSSLPGEYDQLKTPLAWIVARRPNSASASFRSFTILDLVFSVLKPMR